MNDRIIELRKEAWRLVQEDLQTNERDEPVTEREHTKMVFDKFAALIVNECAQVCESITKEGEPLHLVSLGYSQNIKKHFGVE